MSVKAVKKDASGRGRLRPLRAPGQDHLMGPHHKTAEIFHNIHGTEQKRQLDQGQIRKYLKGGGSELMKNTFTVTVKRGPGSRG